MKVVSGQFVITLFEDGTTEFFANDGTRVDDHSYELMVGVWNLLQDIYNPDSGKTLEELLGLSTTATTTTSGPQNDSREDMKL